MAKPWRAAISTVAGLALTAPGGVWAAGFRLFDQDAAATGRAGAFTATADNASAVFFNPAGLAWLGRAETRVETYSVYPKVEYTTPDGRGSTENRTRVSPVPALYASLPLPVPRVPVTLGFGMYSPYGLGLDYPDNAPFRTAGKQARIVDATASFVAACRVSRTLSVGIGPTLSYVDAKLARGIIAPGDGFRFHGSGQSAGWVAGILWQPTPQHSFGVSYHSSTDVRLSGHTDVTFFLPPPPTPFGPGRPVEVHFPQEDADATLHLPRFLVAGYSFRPTPAWNFEFDLDWTDWDSLNTVALRQGRSGTLPLVFNYESSFVYKFGATRRFTNGLLASAGYEFLENSVPEASFSPAVPDGDRHVFTAGLGGRAGGWDWNAAYEFVYQPTRHVANNTGADGAYRLTAHALNLSAGYHF